jgi:hypothetical protein
MEGNHTNVCHRVRGFCADISIGDWHHFNPAHRRRCHGQEAMKNSYVLAVFLVVLAAPFLLCDSSDSLDTSSSDANDAESPPYKVLDKTEKYEERRYEEGTAM